MPPFFEHDNLSLYCGNCLDVLATLPENSVDFVVTDPPYGISFMERNWDHEVPGPEYWRAVARVCKPGAMLLAFGGTRTYHRLICAIEDAGWEIRDCLMWLYGQGFPKAADIGKLIDKAKGAQREGIGDKLAEGLKFAPALIGKADKRYAISHRGVAITSYEPRGSMADAVGLVVNPVGELHGARGNPERVICDSLTICYFVREDFPKYFGGLAGYAWPMLEGTAGWKLRKKDWQNLILRTSIMERCLSIREGYVPTRDDLLPDRFFDEVIYNKYGEPKSLDREKFFETRKKTYLAFGLNEEGFPTRKRLKALGMEFVIPVLKEKLGAAW